MIYFFPNILSLEECRTLLYQFDKEKLNMVSSDIKSDTNKSYGFRPNSNIFNEYMDKVKDTVLNICPKEIIGLNNVNTYIREYLNDSFLVKHIDRKDISVTMSICLESTIKTEWPLCAEVNNKVKCFNTNIGDGVLLFDADKNTHWRDRLYCNENERVVQFFLHWSPSLYEGKKKNTLI
jgi:hypothetical protein